MTWVIVVIFSLLKINNAFFVALVDKEIVTMGVNAESRTGAQVRPHP